MEGLTPNQILYFLAIVEHIREFHSFPTMIELALSVGVTKNAASEMINRLTKKGFLEVYFPGKHRVKGATFEPRFKRNRAIRTQI